MGCAVEMMSFGCKLFIAGSYEKLAAPLRTLSSVHPDSGQALSLSMLGARMVATVCISYRVPDIEGEAGCSRAAVITLAKSRPLVC